VERLQKCRDGCKIDCLLKEYNKIVSERNTLKKALEAAKEDIHTMNTLCLTEGGCCSCCGDQNDALLDCACDFCKKSGVGCWVQDKDDSERCAAFEWRGVQQAQKQEAEK